MSRSRRLAVAAAVGAAGFATGALSGCPRAGQSAGSGPPLGDARTSWTRVLGGGDITAAMTVTADGDATWIGGVFVGDLPLTAYRPEDGGPGAGPVGASVPARGGSDGFVARLDAGGQLTWMLRLGGPGDDAVTAVAAAGEGRVAIAGVFTGAAGLTAHPVPRGDTAKPPASPARSAAVEGSGQPDAVIALADRDGAVRWLRPVYSTHYVRITDIDAAPDGTVAVAGVFGGTARIGDAVVTSAGAGDALAAVIGPDGAVRWARRFGGPGADTANAIAIAPGTGDRADVAIAGSFTAPADLLGTEVPGRGESQDAFTALLARDGTPRWVRTLPGTGTESATAVALDADAVVVAGSYGNALLVRGELVPGAGETDAFAIAYDRAGDVKWVVTIGGEGRDHARGVAVAGVRERASGPPLGGAAIAVVGTFEGRARAGDRDLASEGAHDAFAVMLTRDGAVVAAYPFGGAGHDAIGGVAMTQTLTVVAGSFERSAKLAGPWVPARGTQSGFVFRWPH